VSGLRAIERPRPSRVATGRRTSHVSTVAVYRARTVQYLQPCHWAHNRRASAAGDGVGKGFKRAAKRQGPKDGEKLFKWIRGIVLAGGGLTGTAVGLPHLIAMYLQAFGWLEMFARLFR
jgi:hypothetical protein